MLPIKAYYVKALLQGSIVESSPHVFDNPRWGVGHLLMTGSYHRVLNACFINLHSWCEIAPYPVPATCRVIQSARSRLHGHAKAKRDRASGRSRVVEATKEHYLAWRDTMGRQRAGQTVQIGRLPIFCSLRNRAHMRHYAPGQAGVPVARRGAGPGARAGRPMAAGEADGGGSDSRPGLPVGA